MDGGELDWATCWSRHLVRDAHHDHRTAATLIDVAREKMSLARSSGDRFAQARIALLYDALRTFLEVVALKHGVKIYNHECYAPFLSEVLHERKFAKEFDDFRKIRNGINYYGRRVNEGDVSYVIADLDTAIKKVETML